MMELMKQQVHEVIPVAKQVAAIYAGTNGYLDDVPVEQVRLFEGQLYDLLDSTGAAFVKKFNAEKTLTDETKAMLNGLLANLKQNFKP